MIKPIHYCREVRIDREMPYQLFPGTAVEAEFPLGWLPAGRVVWLRPTEGARADGKVSAFAEGVGMMLVRTSICLPGSLVCARLSSAGGTEAKR